MCNPCRGGVSRRTTTTAATNRVPRVEHKKGGDPEGESGSPLGLLGSRFEVVGARGLRSQDRLPPQLGNGMALDLADALCGDTPDRTDISELGLSAVDESVAAANHVGGALV
jgi:hypothetical protein